MHDETLERIHKAYASATEFASLNPVAIETMFCKKLDKMLDEAQITSEDIPAMDLFLDKVSKSVLARKMTFQSTNMCTEILHTAMYIVIWLNDKLHKDIDTNITARRKSLESELTKELELSDRLVATQIKDLFGIRFIVLNSKNGLSLSCFLATKILNILCSLNRCDRKDFLKYIEKFDDDTQNRIKKLLDIPFTLETLHRSDTRPFVPAEHPEIELPSDEDRKMVAYLKDNMKFYFDPKWNGYQSIHFILSIDNISPIMPGFQIELQFRTWKMHEFAENDIDASHDAHKEGVADYAKIFHLSNEELQFCRIRGFNSYKDNENDIDGIHFPKVFYNRRMNRASFENGIL